MQPPSEESLYDDQPAMTRCPYEIRDVIINEDIYKKEIELEIVRLSKTKLKH